MSVGRNDPCPCGSGKKYKKCCLAGGRFEGEGAANQPALTPAGRVEAADAALEVGDAVRARRLLQPLLERAGVAAPVWALACRIEMRARDFTRAAGYMAKALEQAPDNPRYLYNYGTALALGGELEKAVAVYRRALEIKPDFWVVYHNLAHSLRDLGRSAEAVECYRRVFHAGVHDISSMSQVLLSMHLFATDEHAEMFEMHCRLGRELTAQAPGDTPRRREFPRRDKIRLGYLSPRFSREIVGYFFKPLFDHHDRSQFELYLYSATPRSDDLTGHFSARADRWIPIGDLSDAELCQRIVDDEIDILVDLAGHAPESRIAALARKPAPVQVSMLDYFDTTGVAAMDYYVTDHFSTPPDSPQQFTEELLYLDRPRLVYEAPGYAPAVRVRDPRQGGIVFGSFNRHHKIVPRVVETWAKLLREIPDARLVLKSGAFSREDVRRIFLQRFAAAGVEAQRIELRGASPHEQLLAEYGDIDIALDTFPYNGGLTTCEALWMGTPVITLLGERLISRQSAGMLNAVGLAQFVAADVDEFARIGRYWADHRDELNALRRGLREQMAASPLTDARAYAADFEGQLRSIWERFLQAQAASQAEGASASSR